MEEVGEEWSVGGWLLAEEREDAEELSVVGCLMSVDEELSEVGCRLSVIAGGRPGSVRKLFFSDNGSLTTDNSFPSPGR
jgi:hypothetical protein